MHPESAMCPTDRGVYLALDGLVSWDAISESGNVAKRSSVPPGYVICQWSETGMR